MIYNMMYIVWIKILQNRYNNSSVSNYCYVRYAPISTIFTNQRDFCAFFDTNRVK